MKRVDKHRNERLLSNEEIKEIMTGIMDEIELFCTENGINYFLYYGTLIGAVRHQGFIPWDDDLDICMPREDYNRFIKTFNNAERHYRAISIETDKDYYLPYAKVVDTNTRLKESVSCTIPIGVYVDVFPLDYCPEDDLKREKKIQHLIMWRKVLSAKNMEICKDRRLNKNVILTIAKTVLFPVSRKTIILLINKIVTKDDNETNYVGVISYPFDGIKEVMRREWFSKSELCSFEGREYKIPAEYDKILRTLYGNYMELPPQQEQCTHHSYYAWRIDG